MRTILLFLAVAVSANAQTPFVFRDVGEETGLLPAVGGIRGHGAAWGDIDGSGFPSLFVNAFHNQMSKPAMLLRNSRGKFTLDGQEHLRTSGMGSGALFVDLDNSGRLDLYSSNCASESKDAVGKIPSSLFRNDGGGKFTDVSAESGACPPIFNGRGLAALDADGDGKLDLLLTERYYGPVKHGPMLLHNLGKHRFKNVSEEVGLPKQLSGLGLAAADLNNDGWPDVVLTEGAGNHRVYLNDRKGNFVEATGAKEVLQWKNVNKNDSPAGVCIADVNRDGLPDIVIGHHNKAPWKEPAPIRLYLNRGTKDGVPIFEDVTEKAGLGPLVMKPPHLEVHDFDNDGLADIYVSIVKYKDGVPHPIIYKNFGNKDGVPQFRADALKVNDFPNQAELAVKRTGDFYDKLMKDKRIIYMAAGPAADFDRDGRMDLFLANWWIESPSLLLRNETPSGNWLNVRVEGTKGVNRMGVGSKVRVFPAGKLGDASALLGQVEIAIGYGYCSGQEAIAHFGLADAKTVDVEVILPHGRGVFSQKGVAANQHLTLKQP